jgi:hypothetical protein
MFFSSHVTGQSHNPARGRRLTQSCSIQRGDNLPQHYNTSKRFYVYFLELDVVL